MYLNFILENFEIIVISILLIITISTICILFIQNNFIKNTSNKIDNYHEMIKKNNLPTLTNGDVYHFDIIGLNVIDKDGNQKLGTIKNILNFGAGDIAEILSNDGDFFVPLMPNDLDHIDSKNGTIFLSNFDKWKNINK